MGTKKTNGNGHSSAFQAFATNASYAVGTRWAFLAALAVILGWIASGPYFHYSDTWQLVINTATTIITFLMVFLIQNTQNRDARAIHLKLDEIIHAIQAAHNELIDIEHLPDDQLQDLAKHYEQIRAECDRRHQAA